SLAVAVTSLLWDHLLILGDEIELIWRKRRWSLVQKLVVANYYGVHGAMIFFAYVLSGMHLSFSDKHRCRGFGVFMSTYGLISVGFSQLVLLMCTVNVWDNRSSVKVALAIGFVICYSMSAAFDALTIRQLFTPHFAQYDKVTKFCVMSRKATYLPGIWGGELLYDLYVVVLLFINSLSRPRRSDHEVVTNLVRDGGLLFIVCSSHL
ncbi:uncharacterized protein LAESUDRAFT_660970, partial [Laetiporus sulphureus 93-53]